ncbi:MAG: YjbF family lipoprotein [Paracoccaceae bacterium]
MIAFRKAAALAAVVGLTAMAGCGNQTDQGVVFKSVLSGVTGKNKPAAPMTPAETNAAIQSAMAGTDLPLALAQIETRKATAVLVNIETNGGYRTWGTSDRRTITTRNGIVTATRGLGNDIMSSSVGGVEGLITARKAGQGSHALRFLDGENHTVELAAECQVTRGGSARVSGGALNDVAAVEMRESCSAGDQHFSNTYLVDARGRVLQSRQWLGPANGQIVLQILR